MCRLTQRETPNLETLDFQIYQLILGALDIKVPYLGHNFLTFSEPMESQVPGISRWAPKNGGT